MKAILIKVTNTSKVRICSNVLEAVEFLNKSGIFVNEKTKEHLALGFEKLYLGKDNDKGCANYSLSAGNNSGNPTIWMLDVTGLSSIAEMSPNNIKKVVREVEVKLQKKKADFKLHTEHTEASVIRGGFYWYWSQMNNRHFPLYELWMKTTSFNSLVELKEALLSKGLEMISKYGKED